MTSIVTNQFDNGAHEPLLNWHRSDIEQRLGFSSKVYERQWSLSFLIASALSVMFYAGLSVRSTYFSVMFTERGWVHLCIVFLSAWSVAILAFKYVKLRFQTKALDYDIAPQDPDFVLSGATVGDVDQIHATFDDPKKFVLSNRSMLASSNLRNLGQVGDVDEILPVPKESRTRV